MPWEVYKRELSGREETPMVTLGLTGRITLNVAASEIFKLQKAGRVDLLWDSELSKLGIKVARNRGAFPLKAARRNAMISATTFFNHIRYDWSASRSFPAVWDEKDSILVIDIPREHLNGKEPIRRNRSAVKLDGSEMKT